VQVAAFQQTRAKAVSIQYYALLVTIFEPHKDVNVVNSVDSPRNIITGAKVCFETLLRVYHMRHGYETYDYALLEYLPLLAFSSLRDSEFLSSGLEKESRQSTQLLCAKGLWEQSKNMSICRAIFGQFKDALTDPNMQQEIGRFTHELPQFDQVLKQLRSNWPVGVFNIPKGGGDLSVTPFLQRSARLLQLESQATQATVMEVDD
jgi:hypothetical protein